MKLVIAVAALLSSALLTIPTVTAAAGPSSVSVSANA